jgi:pyruvate dehydrogenase E2 component (dihydrolipoamide acetyltransferase)
MNAVIMPALGQTSDELKILAWLKQEGEVVGIGEPLVNLETDKTTIEVESAFGGVLLKIVHGVDAVILAGQVIAYIGQPGETPPETLSTPPTQSAPVTPPTSPPPEAPPPPAAPPPAGKVLATPAARQLARERGIDLAALTGSGPDGRIEREDVETWTR